MKKTIQQNLADLSASVVVLLVALPLCLGIALASGAPLFAGIIGGIVGGIIVGLISKSALSVSGPAAGLTVIVAGAITQLQSFNVFLLAVCLAGIIQIVLGIAKAGIIGDYIPNAVIKGMLAAIGIILILKQIPHLVGFDKDYVGDLSFKQGDNENTFTELIKSWYGITLAPLLIGLFSLVTLYVWELKLIKKNVILRWIPGPLVVVFMAVFLATVLGFYNVGWQIEQQHLVNLPIATTVNQFFSFFSLPNFSAIMQLSVWKIALTLAVVASLETLLGIEAVDKLDNLKRITPANRELVAQGVGNVISGLIGGIPVTSVIVRSSANVNAGAKSKNATIFHGLLLLISVILIPQWLNKIPLSALAAILIFTGYKLAKLSLFKEFYRKGLDQFIPFAGTILAILVTDLLIGIIIGIIVGLFFMVRSNFKSAILVVNDKAHYLLRLRKDVSFLNKPIIKRALEAIPPNSFLVLDTTKADFIDQDIIEEINNFMVHAHLKHIQVDIKKSIHKPMHALFVSPQN
ncbi:MAG: SulP family inorganic anion transporter [Chitinophagaceae bacterium]